MVGSIRATIVYRGNLVRSRIARRESVMHYLARIPSSRSLADHEVVYWSNGIPTREPATVFIEKYQNDTVK